MKSDKAKKHLLQAIKKAGSQKAFAAIHDVSEAYVSDLVNGKRGFGDRMLEKLGLEIDYVKIKSN